MSEPLTAPLYPVAPGTRAKLISLGHHLPEGMIARLTDEDTVLIGRGEQQTALELAGREALLAVIAAQAHAPPQVLPEDNSALVAGQRYWLSPGATVQLPASDLSDGDSVGFIPQGDVAAQPASLQFAHPVQNEQGQTLAQGSHQYNSNQSRLFVFYQGVWW